MFLKINDKISDFYSLLSRLVIHLNPFYALKVVTNLEFKSQFESEGNNQWLNRINQYWCFFVLFWYGNMYLTLDHDRIDFTLSILGSELIWQMTCRVETQMIDIPVPGMHA